MTSRVKEQKAKEKDASSTGKPASVLEAHGFSIGETLGHGSYATVKWAVSAKHKCKVAIKIVSKRKAPEDYLAKFLPREIEVIKHLKHPNLICFLQSIETTSRMYLIMEMADNGDLLDYIKSHGAISETQSGIWFHQLVDGIEYCHSQGVVHRDLKCENLLLNKHNNLKVTDFGFARGNMKSRDGRIILSETYCGSYAYAPPEILRGIPYDPLVGDIWSMGVILFTMIFGRLPFDDTNHKILIHQVQSRVQFPSNKTITEDCKDLVCRILSPAKTRIHIHEMRKDPWFSRMSQYYKLKRTKTAQAAAQQQCSNPGSSGTAAAAAGCSADKSQPGTGDPSKDEGVKPQQSSKTVPPP